MNDLNRALGDISSIRGLDGTQYGVSRLPARQRSAATGLFSRFWPQGSRGVLSWRTLWPISSTYLSIWICTAGLSAALTGIQMYTRTRRMHSGMSQEMMHMAVEQFLPSVGAGLLITLVLVRYVLAALIPGSGRSFSAWAYFRLAGFCPGQCLRRAPGTS